jgi:hypothetical protein
MQKHQIYMIYLWRQRAGKPDNMGQRIMSSFVVNPCNKGMTLVKASFGLSTNQKSLIMSQHALRTNENSLGSCWHSSCCRESVIHELFECENDVSDMRASFRSTLLGGAGGQAGKLG